MEFQLTPSHVQLHLISRFFAGEKVRFLHKIRTKTNNHPIKKYIQNIRFYSAIIKGRVAWADSRVANFRKNFTAKNTVTKRFNEFCINEVAFYVQLDLTCWVIVTCERNRYSLSTMNEWKIIEIQFQKIYRVPRCSLFISRDSWVLVNVIIRGCDSWFIHL